MPAATRSSNTQSKPDDAEDRRANASRKRKPAGDDGTIVKKWRTADGASSLPTKSSAGPVDDLTEKNTGTELDVITINRAPVLELWASCVAQFLHPSVPWETCLGAGGAIATITAISKGRSIGAIKKPDPAEPEERRKKRQYKPRLEELEVMHFHLRIKDGQVVVGEKPKTGNEAALKKKFGEQSYTRAKETFEEVLATWTGHEQDLDSQAFHFYESFRPSVPEGQKGWGRKGQLNLQSVRDTIARPG